MRRIGFTAAAAVAAVALLASCAASWVQFGGNQTHSNVATQSNITPDNVSQLTKRWQVTLPELIAGQPTYAPLVKTPSGTKNLIIAGTWLGGVVAVDASNGHIVWQHQVPNPNACITLQSGSVPCRFQGSAALDLQAKAAYSYVPVDGMVHKYDLATGTELTTGGFPQVVTLKQNLEKVSSNITIATFGSTRYLYVTTAGYGNDLGDYQGHLVAINLTTGTQKVFNALCSDQPVHFVASPGTPDCPVTRAGVWSRSGVLADPDTNKLYMTTGNAPFDPSSHNWGSSILALNPDGSGLNGDPVDSYTPTNWSQLTGGDLDLGSSTPTALPSIPGSAYAHVGVMGGKDGILRLVDLDNLSGQGGIGHTGGELGLFQTPQGGQILNQPVVWTDPSGQIWVLTTTRYDVTFQVGTGGVSGMKVSVDANGKPVLTPGWVIDGALETKTMGPVTSSGVYFVTPDKAIVALDARTGTPKWFAPLPGISHMNMPLVINNWVFAPDDGRYLTAFSL